MSLLQQLNTRGLIHDVSHHEELEKQLESASITFYCGFDPTADSLHVGSMLPLIIMRRLQRAGHKPLVILGSATGMIGDPSGKSEERKLLTEEVIQENMRGIENQLGLFLSATGKNKFVLLKNDSWIAPMSCIEFLRDVGKHFTVNTMMQKDSVKGRLESREHGISYTEFSYMLLQAYDFYWLYKNYNCILQIGGSDQWGNITAGIEFARRKLQSGTSPIYGFTFPLLTTSSGAKFGKTEKGNVWLDPKKTSPFRFYQYWVNSEDKDVINYIKFFTDLDGADLAALEESMKKSPEERLPQRELAGILTELVHGETERQKAVVASRVLFGEEFSSLDEETLREIFADVPSTVIARDQLNRGIPILDLLQTCKLVTSKSEGRRLIEGGGTYINNVRISDTNYAVNQSSLATKNMLVLRSGKKNYHLVSIA